MRHESIIPQTDGSKIKAIVVFYDNSYSEKFNYRIELLKFDKGKRKGYTPYDDDSYQHRALSMNDRTESIKNQIIEILGKDKYNNLLTEAWNLLKPELI